MQITIVIGAVSTAAGTIAATKAQLQGLTGATQAAGAAAQTAGGHTVGFMDKLGRIAAGVAVAILVMGALQAAFDAVVGGALSFDTAMHKIAAFTPIAAADIGILKGAIEDLAKKYPVSETEIAAGAYFILSSNIKDVTEATHLLELATAASAVGMGNMEDIAFLLTSAINAYGLTAADAEGIMDDLNTAVELGVGEVDEYAGALGRVMGMADLAGVSFDEMAANLAAATQAGLSVDEAVTGLNQTLRNLAFPAAETHEALAEIGWSADQLRASIKDRGLLATLLDLRNLTQGNFEAIDKLIPNSRALTETLIALGDDGSRYAAILLAMETNQGDFNESVEQGKGLAFRLGVVWNNVKIELQNVGEYVLPLVASGLEWFIHTGWPRMREEIGKAVDQLKTDFIPVWEDVQGVWEDVKPAIEDVLDAMSPVIDFMDTHKTTIIEFGIVFLGLSASIWATNAAIGAFIALSVAAKSVSGIGITLAILTALFLLTIKYWDDIKRISPEDAKRWYTEYGDWLILESERTYFQLKGYWEGVSPMLSEAWKDAKTSLTEGPSLADIFGLEWADVGAAFSTEWGKIKADSALWWQEFKYDLGIHLEDTKAALSSAWQDAKDIFSNAWRRIREDFNLLWAGLKSDFNETITFFQDIPGRIAGALSTLPGVFLDAGRDVGNAIAEGFNDGISWLKGAARTVFNEVIDQINALIKAYNSIPMLPDVDLVARIAPAPGSLSTGVNPGGGHIPMLSGAWDIPINNLPALLHRGEMVLPEGVASKVRSAATGGVSDSGLIAELRALRKDVRNMKIMLDGEVVGRIQDKRLGGQSHLHGRTA